MYAIYDTDTEKFATTQIFCEFEDAASSRFNTDKTFITEVVLDEFNITGLSEFTCVRCSHSVPRVCNSCGEE